MLGFAFVAAARSTVGLEPGQAGFDDPAVPAEALGALDRLAGDPHGDPASADLRPQGRNVVGLVRMEFGGTVPRPAPAGADRGDRVQQRHHDLRVVDVRSWPPRRVTRFATL
ncbi:hypothetical protein GCM10009558_021690 [Virgisporangium aurantiacum]